MKFNDKLRMLIEEKELTQKEVAIQLKIPVSTLGGYVQGTSEPDFQTLILFADFFNVTTDFLLNHTLNHEKTFNEDIERLKGKTEEIVSFKGKLSQGADYVLNCYNKLNEALELEEKTGKCYDSYRQAACYLRCDADMAEDEYRFLEKKKQLLKNKKV